MLNKEDYLKYQDSFYLIEIFYQFLVHENENSKSYPRYKIYKFVYFSEEEAYKFTNLLQAFIYSRKLDFNCQQTAVEFFQDSICKNKDAGIEFNKGHLKFLKDSFESNESTTYSLEAKQNQYPYEKSNYYYDSSGGNSKKINDFGTKYSENDKNSLLIEEGKQINKSESKIKNDKDNLQLNKQPSEVKKLSNSTTDINDLVDYINSKPYQSDKNKTKKKKKNIKNTESNQLNQIKNELIVNKTNSKKKKDIIIRERDFEEDLEIQKIENLLKDSTINKCYIYKIKPNWK